MLARKTFTVPATCPTCAGLVILKYAALLGGSETNDVSWSCPHQNCDGGGSLRLHGELLSVTALSSKIARKTNTADTGVAFLRTQLQIGVTFVGLAVTASTPEGRARNKASAMQALVAALKQRPGVLKTPEEHAEIERKTERLRTAINRLGLDDG